MYVHSIFLCTSYVVLLSSVGNLSVDLFVYKSLNGLQFMVQCQWGSREL